MKQQLLTGLLLALILTGCSSRKAFTATQPQPEVKKEVEKPKGFSMVAFEAPVKFLWWFMGVKKSPLRVITNCKSSKIDNNG